jgi:hypothetical protein
LVYRRSLRLSHADDALKPKNFYQQSPTEALVLIETHDTTGSGVLSRDWGSEDFFFF